MAAGDADGRVPEAKASAAWHELKRSPPVHLSAEQEHMYIEDIEKRWYAQAQTESTTTTRESLESAGPALEEGKGVLEEASPPGYRCGDCQRISQCEG